MSARDAMQDMTQGAGDAAPQDIIQDTGAVSLQGPAIYFDGPVQHSQRGRGRGLDDRLRILGPRPMPRSTSGPTPNCGRKSGARGRAAARPQRRDRCRRGSKSAIRRSPPHRGSRRDARPQWRGRPAAASPDRRARACGRGFAGLDRDLRSAGSGRRRSCPLCRLRWSAARRRDRQGRALQRSTPAASRRGLCLRRRRRRNGRPRRARQACRRTRTASGSAGAACMSMCVRRAEANAIALPGGAGLCR